jgi:hypothetical protein
MGFLLSPFMLSTPHCKLLNWAIYNGVANITAMWIVFMSWIEGVFMTTKS